jgi:penicillin-binding protein 2
MFVLNPIKQGDRRLRWLAAAFLAGLLVLLGGLWYVQVISRHKYQSSQRAQSFRNVRLPASRGLILDRHGQVLADNQPRFNVNLYLEDLREMFVFEYTNRVKKEFVLANGRQPNRTERAGLGALARYRVASNIAWQVSSAVLPQPLVLNPEAFQKHYRDQLAMPMPVLKSLDAVQIAAFSELAIDLPGVALEVEPYRYYPHGGLAGHVLGYVQREQPAEDEEEELLFRYRLPDYSGRLGVEGAFDRDLRGRAGARAILVNNIGYRQSEETWLPSDPGRNVVLTLDIELQRAAEKALVAGDPEMRGAAVVLDCRTGDILAIASAPSYDLNMFVRPSDFAKDDWGKLSDETLTPQYNRAVQGAYAPGSIAKILVGLACFEAGVMGLDDTVTHPGYYMLGRRRIEDLAPAGTYAFQEAFKYSCNSYFIELGLRAGVDRLIEMGNRFGLGERTGAVPPGQESAGYFPKPGDLQKKDGSRWMDGDTANLCIGQGEIVVTPLQMALMTAAVANGGNLLKPRLVLRLEDRRPFGETEALPGPEIERNLNLDPRHLEWTRKAMLADVEETGGTGRAAFIPGLGVSGKTGTAQVKLAHRMDHITWFVSFAPYASPKYVVVVMVESGSSGGGTCAPKAKQIYQAILKLEAQRNAHRAEVAPRAWQGGQS